MNGTEFLGIPYQFELSLLSEVPNIDPDDVIGNPLAVGIRMNNGKERCFHGIVTSFAKTGITHRHTRYHATLRPLLSQFDDTSDCRVFNDSTQHGRSSQSSAKSDSDKAQKPKQNALSIVISVLAERGLTDVESGSIEGHMFRAREYCVQYRESDLHFVQRLLEEEGIYYFFRHEETKHTLVLADAINGHKPADGYESVLYSPRERRHAGVEEHFWGMKVRNALYPGQHTVLAGYDATKMRPKQPQFGEASSVELAPGSQFEHYDYPGGLFDPAEAAREAEIRSQVGHVENTIVEVEGNTMGLGVGDLVILRTALESLEGTVPSWDEKDLPKEYLIVGASYSLSINQHETGEVVKSDEPYKAKYWLLDSHTPFRPRRKTLKTRLQGSQTALVVGPEGEEIHTDELGRVMVQFDWDRLGERNEKSSCWIRVSQVWAGANWGAIHIPRIGQEVMVDFLDGDPDRPIITGRLYNADNMPPYDLPGNKTQSGIKSRSSKGGTANNFNEIRFEDKKGHEELHTQAERDMSTLVKHNQSLHVGVDRSIVVGNDETTLVKNNRSTTVEKNDNETIFGTHEQKVGKQVIQTFLDNHTRKITGDQALIVDKNKTEFVKLAYTLTTDQKFELIQGDTSMTYEGNDMTLACAGMIKMFAGGATISVSTAGMITMTSPTGINLICAGSGISLLPGGIAVAAAAVTAAAGPSKMEMGEKTVAMTSKTVNIEAETVCSIRGKRVLKLNTT